MRFNFRLYACGLILVGLVGGCANVRPRASFEPVRRDVERRTGHRIRWYRGTAEDAGAGQEVREMLRDHLTVHEAVQVALLNNRRLQGLYEDLGVAQAELVEAGLLSNPVFEGSIRFNRGHRPAIDLAVVEEFISIFMIPLRRQAAAADVERTKLEVTGRVMDLARRVTVEFYRHQGALQMLRMRRSVVDATEASYRMSERLRDAGNATRLSVLQQRALHEQAKLDLSAAELTVEESRERLNRLMGLWGPDVGWKVASRLPDIPSEGLDLERVEQRAIENSVDLAMARRGLEATAGRVGITDVESVLPELVVGAEAEREPDLQWEVGPALSLPLPLFDQGQPERAAARGEFRRLWENYTALAVEVRSAVRAARHRLMVARRRVRYYQRVVVPLQKQILRQTQRRYNGMFLGVFQLLQAKQQEIRTRRRSIEELRNYWIARTELEQILAGRLVEGSGVSVSTGGPIDRSAGGH